MRWWLVTDPEYSLRFRTAHKPIKDVGVDICAIPHDGGKPTAVQCKQYVGEIRKSEIDSFLSAAATDEYADSLLIHTGSGFSDNAATTIAAQRSRCDVVDLERLLQSDVVWPTSIDALDTGAKRPPQDPRAHQLVALARIRSEFLSSGRARTWVNMACGSGKTLVATLAADEFAAELAVVFSAETVALHEAVRAWTRDARLKFTALRICSKQDATTSDDPNLPHENRTTSRHEIAAFLAREGRRVVFCTYRSATRLAEAAAAAGVTFDLVVADDAHHIASHRTSAMTKAVLDDGPLSARRRLFLTATPRTWETGALSTAKRRGARVVDMRDSITGDFGARAYHLPYLEAQERGIVLPFHVHIVEITTQEVDQVVSSRRMVAATGHTRAVASELAATQIAVVKAADDLGLRRIVAFHHDVDESRIFADSFAGTAALVARRNRSAAPVARHVDAYDARRRRESLSWFGRHPEPCLLSNVKLLAEGLDRPEIDAIIWNDPKPPPSRVVQAVGRALRRHPGKTRATVIVPMIVGPDRNIDKALMTSTFASTIKILDALRTIDPNFKLTRESLRFYAATRHSGTVSRTVITDWSEAWDAPLDVTAAFADAINHLLLAPRVAPRPVDHERLGLVKARTIGVRSPEVGAACPTREPEGLAYERGLGRLECLSRDKLLFGLDTPDDIEWLGIVRDRLRRGTLPHSDLERIAGHLSFLAAGLGPLDCELRLRLGRNADRSVPAQLAAWIRAPHAPSSYLAALAAIARTHHWQLESLLGCVHSALTHAGMSPIDRARVSLRPLLAAADGIGEKEDPNSRLAGMLAAIEHPTEQDPQETSTGWRRGADTDSGRADWSTYQAGWDAALPWRAQARLIGALPIPSYAHEIRWASDLDSRRRRKARWDYTTWIVYIDELDRANGRRRVAHRVASEMRYPDRVMRVSRIMARRPVQAADYRLAA